MSVRAPLRQVLMARQRRASTARRQRVEEQALAMSAVALDPTGVALRRALDEQIQRDIDARKRAADDILVEVERRLFDHRDGFVQAIRQLAAEVALAVSVAPFVGVSPELLVADHRFRQDALIDTWSRTVTDTVRLANRRLEALAARYPASCAETWPSLLAPWADHLPRLPCALPVPMWGRVASDVVRVLVHSGPVLGSEPRDTRISGEHHAQIAVLASTPTPARRDGEAPWDLVRRSWRAY